MRILKTFIILLACIQTLSGQAFDASVDPVHQKMGQFYDREVIPLPEGETMEIGSIALLPDQKVAVATRRGFVWICEGAFGDDLTQVKWTKAYDGLHEPLGMYYKDGSIYFTDRDQFGKITDTDGDGRFDVLESINSDFGITGDYHEYNFGSMPDKEGNVWAVLCLTGSAGAKADWRGWAVRFTPDGKMLPTCSGIRSPGGIGFDIEGNAYYTDNQGFWNGTSCLKHLVPGKFMGNYSGNIFYEKAPHMGAEPPTIPVELEKTITLAKARDIVPQLVPPAIQFPHAKMGQSPTAVFPDHTGGKFGVFAGQTLVGEVTHSEVQRVHLETVNGVRQGAAFKMFGGFNCGVVSAKLSDDGHLFLGCTNRGWGARGGSPFSFERVKWNGKTPFEMKTMEAQPNGFKCTFTKPVNKELAGNPASYEMDAWTYYYVKGYGSPEVEQTKPVINSVTVAEDGLSVTLEVSGLVKGHIHALNYPKLVSAEGEEIWHPTAYYTLNEIPKG